ncbi:hypothetical protein Hanom_Chr14g01255381 [Helianthus anomalus]
MEELASAWCNYKTIKQKLDSYSNSKYVLDHIIDTQKKIEDVKCICYQSCSPPMRHNYTKLPDDEDMPHFEPTIPLDPAEFAIDSPIAMDGSGDESNKEKPEQLNIVTKESNIPLENHILCGPPIERCGSAPVKSDAVPVKNFESVNLLYTLIGSHRIYSNNDFPIRNVNQYYP